MTNEKCKNCEHEEKYHYNKQVPTGKIFMCVKWINEKYCGCKKFEPKDNKGCGRELE